jgi:hypothetical protein
MQDKPASLYTRLGGYDAIAAVVDDLLPRLRSDELLSRFWVRERLNKGWNSGQGGMAICSVSTKRVYWAALMPYWGGYTVAGLVADTLRPLAAQ